MTWAIRYGGGTGAGHRAGPVTTDALLTVYAMILSVVMTVPLATWAALHKGRLADRAVRVFVILSLGMPAYWVGMMLLQIFAVRYRIFPVSGWGHGVFGHLESLFCRLCRWRWRSRR